MQQQQPLAPARRDAGGKLAAPTTRRDDQPQLARARDRRSPIEAAAIGDDDLGPLGLGQCIERRRQRGRRIQRRDDDGEHRRHRPGCQATVLVAARRWSRPADLGPRRPAERLDVVSCRFAMAYP
jgi:hypothetical protein